MAISVELSAAQLRSIEKAIAKLGDSKSVNALVGKAARVAARTHLIKPAKAAMPVGKAPANRRPGSKPKHSPGQLRKATKLRSIKRSRISAGVRVGFGDKDFVGDQFYGAFLEYGFHARGTKVPGRGMLKGVAEKHGKAAQDMAAKLIADALETMAKK